MVKNTLRKNFIEIFKKICYNLYRIKKGEKDTLPLYISLLFGIILFTLHATIDFDLNYLLTISIYYMFIGIMNKEDKTITITTKANKIIDYAVIGTMIVVLIITLKTKKKKKILKCMI